MATWKTWVDGEKLYAADINALQVQKADIVTPEQYGAVGDGIANDSSALLSMAASGDNRTFWLDGEKNYRISDTILPRSGQRWRGHGKITQTAVDTPIFYVNAKEDLRFTEPRLIGKKTDFDGAPSDSMIFRIEDSADIWITAGILSDFGYAGVYLHASDDVFLLYNKIKGPGSSTISPGDNHNFAIRQYGSDATNNILVLGNLFEDCATGIATYENNFGWVVDSNIFNRMVGQHGIYGLFHKSSISRNILKDIEWDGMKFWMPDSLAVDVEGLSVTDNVISLDVGASHGIPIQVNTGSSCTKILKNFLFAHNTLTGGLDAAIYLFQGHSGYAYKHHGSVIDNLIRDNGGYGIYAVLVEGIIGRNHIKDVDGTGIFVSNLNTGDLISILGNTLEQVSKNPGAVPACDIYIDHAKAVVKDNNCWNHHANCLKSLKTTASSSVHNGENFFDGVATDIAGSTF
jgi:hypothetical protein